MNYFNDYFKGIRYKDDFGWNKEWNKETDKWLALVNSFDHEYYLKSKSRVMRETERDGFLAEIRSMYFLTNSLGLRITEIEPMKSLIDFKFVSPTGVDWFAEVKHPSWKGEVFKDGKLTHEQKINRTSKQQFINGEGSWISARDAIEDCIKNSIHKFTSDTNNLVIINPNLKSAVLIWGKDHIKGVIQEMIKLYDTNDVISAILILEVVQSTGENFTYIHHLFPIKTSII